MPPNRKAVPEYSGTALPLSLGFEPLVGRASTCADLLLPSLCASASPPHRFERAKHGLAKFGMTHKWNAQTTRAVKPSMPMPGRAREARDIPLSPQVPYEV